MILIVKLIGFAIMIFGLAIFVSPPLTQKIFAFFREGKRIYYAGMVRVAAGFALLVSAPQSRLPLAAITLGVLFLLSGIIIFVTDTEKMKAFMAQYAGLPALTVRLLGLVGACFGLLMVSVL